MDGLPKAWEAMLDGWSTANNGLARRLDMIPNAIDARAARLIYEEAAKWEARAAGFYTCCRALYLNCPDTVPEFGGENPVLMMEADLLALHARMNEAYGEVMRRAASEI